MTAWRLQGADGIVGFVTDGPGVGQGRGWRFFTAGDSTSSALNAVQSGMDFSVGNASGKQITLLQPIAVQTGGCNTGLTFVLEGRALR